MLPEDTSGTRDESLDKLLQVRGSALHSRQSLLNMWLVLLLMPDLCLGCAPKSTATLLYKSLMSHAYLARLYLLFRIFRYSLTLIAGPSKNLRYMMCPRLLWFSSAWRSGVAAQMFAAVLLPEDCGRVSLQILLQPSYEMSMLAQCLE